jgi:hypothetical protein
VTTGFVAPGSASIPFPFAIRRGDGEERDLATGFTKLPEIDNNQSYNQFYQW